MNAPEPTTETALQPNVPEGGEPGKIIEHILLSITVVSNHEGAGQFDDSCAYQVQKALHQYHGVEQVEARVLYEHTKIEHHVAACTCGRCQPDRAHDPLPTPEAS